MAKNRYLAALRKWDWGAIKAEALSGLEDDEENPGTRVGRSYLGTVFSLAPSGKYYTPFANSNVDPCPRCRGTGHARNPVACGWCGGSGHRSVAALAKARGETVEETVRLLGTFPAKGYRVKVIDEATMAFPCFVCEGGLVPVDCSWCGGIGCREAFLDQEWYEALDQVAGEHGLYIESGEGDPCDLFATISVETDEEGDEEPEEAPVEPSAEPREPWQMPRKEYIDLLLDGKIAPPAGVVVTGVQNVGRIADPHYMEVARAVAAGKPVPAEVLAEYPRIEQEVGQMGQAVYPHREVSGNVFREHVPTES